MSQVDSMVKSKVEVIDSKIRIQSDQIGKFKRSANRRSSQVVETD
jgi:hypothetical protein